MTGEITSHGTVLPIGGLTEKVLAAHRAGIRRVLLPGRNEKDLSEVPDEGKEGMTFLPVSSFDDVVGACF
jgi:ATP-dependent Lon protease